jgi:hypothetical protein
LTSKISSRSGSIVARTSRMCRVRTAWQCARSSSRLSKVRVTMRFSAPAPAAGHSASVRVKGDYLYQARLITQDHSAAIATRVPGQEQTMRAKNKIPYYFAVLEHLLGLRLAPEARATEDPG